ncbi:MAG: DUF4091 domain-containing protein [Thermoguttaceae bacterium]|nr:DUF4091 domain-containing protein [Thermoguttaceae bacterium]
MREVQRLKRRAALGLGAALAFGTLGTFGAFGTSAVWSADATPEIRAISQRLCRDGGGEWASAFELFVENATERDWSERAVEIPIAGTPEKPVDGAAPLVGERAESVRFCDSDGVEFVFNIINKDGETVERGEIGEGFSLTIPATVAAKSTARYLVFAGNDRATAHPDQYSQIRRRLSNLDFEAGTGDVPSGWRFDVDGADRSMRWVDENPFSGRKCVRCDVADGAEPSWIAARQGGVAVEPGRKYRFTGRVRGENVRGTVGWYLHLGNEEKPMIAAPLLGFSDKTEFGWTELSEVYSVPADANRLEFGTVLRGTGTAWFDAVEIELVEEPGVDLPKNARPFRIGETFAIPATPTVYPSGDPNATRGAERFEPAKLGIAVEKTLKSEKSAIPQYSGARCVLIRVETPSADGRRLIRLDLAPIETRWGRTLGAGDFAVLDLNAKETPLEFFDGSVFFEANVVAGARNVFAVVEKTGKNGKTGKGAKDGAGRRSAEGANLANQAFPGTTLQTANPADFAGSNENNGDAKENGGAETAKTGETGKADGVALTLPAFLAENNIVADGDFENVDAKTTLPPGESDWSRDADEPGVSYKVVEPGVAALGSKALEMTVDETAELRWRGWRRRVAVEPNRCYLIGYVVSSDSEAKAFTGSFDLHIHSRRADWNLAEGGMSSLGKPVGGKTDWALKTGAIRTTNDCAFLDLHLTSQTRGTARYDSVFVAPVENAEPIAFLGGRTGVFDVPAVVKVFPDTTFAADEAPVGAENPAFCALALNEEETIQLAIRSAKDERLEVVVRAPELKTADGRTVKLDAPEVFAVSNVIVDYPSSYYQETGLETKRKFPTATPQSDGWIGLWPDPLIPVAAKTVKTGKPTPKRSAAENLAARAEFKRRRAELAAEIAAGLAEFERRRAASQNDSLAVDALARVGVAPVDAFATRAIWLRFRTTPETVPGVYVGELVLRDVGGKAEKSSQTEKSGVSGESAQEAATAAVDLDALKLTQTEISAETAPSADAAGTVRVVPYRVEVLPFEAPETNVSAIYDARISADFYGEGTRSAKLEKIGEKLLERKLAPDGPTVAPKFSYNKETGVATADWAEYDRVTGRFFDELGAKAGYFPHDFYLFGWGMPPKEIDGEKPYEGEYPYENVDRSVLRPEYKKAYQAKLKLYWEHIKEKGWDDNLVLYISDEPFYSKREIIVQMKALCDMIHEVDPKIPIYCSTWVFVPEWLGYLDVWGVGHYGLVGEAELAKIRDAGSRIWWTTDGQMCLDAPYNAVERLLPYTCVARGAEAYEFWGATWHTCDPFESASHLYISQSDQPGVRYYVRYPNGDGYIFYPGDLIGRPGEILDSVRSEQARRGVEDAGWLVGLRDAIQTKTKPDSPERAEAQAVLDRALNYLPLQCGCGRFATRYMSDPAEFEAIRLDVGRKLAELTAAP